MTKALTEIFADKEPALPEPPPNAFTSTTLSVATNYFAELEPPIAINVVQHYTVPEPPNAFTSTTLSVAPNYFAELLAPPIANYTVPKPLNAITSRTLSIAPNFFAEQALPIAVPVDDSLYTAPEPSMVTQNQRKRKEKTATVSSDCSHSNYQLQLSYEEITIPTELGYKLAAATNCGLCNGVFGLNKDEIRPTTRKPIFACCVMKQNNEGRIKCSHALCALCFRSQMVANSDNGKTPRSRRAPMSRDVD